MTTPKQHFTCFHQNKSLEKEMIFTPLKEKELKVVSQA
jgi:hypothetical protein